LLIDPADVAKNDPNEARLLLVIVEAVPDDPLVPPAEALPTAPKPPADAEQITKLAVVAVAIET
jgi:hypothetical protein